MYILTSKYFPTDSWPDDYFPALPEGVVDIQYKEVVEFSLAIAATAEFEVVLPNDASVDVGSTDIIVSGAGNAAVNGTYVQNGLRNGKPLYEFGNYVIEWQTVATLSPYWSIRLSSDVPSHSQYADFNIEDVATPDLVTEWSWQYGTTPAPTVTAADATATLTEVAAFTVEMPTVVEMEVYEELSA
jgi:hypothetical protein